MSIARKHLGLILAAFSAVSSASSKISAGATSNCWRPRLSIAAFSYFVFSLFACFLRLHMRARPGLRVEETARLCDQVEAALREEIPHGEVQTILDNIGLPN